MSLSAPIDLPNWMIPRFWTTLMKPGFRSFFLGSYYQNSITKSINLLFTLFRELKSILVANGQ